MSDTDTLHRIVRVYEGSDGDATKALYEELSALGPVGIIATNLFRANKNSSRAKVYRGGVPGKGSYKRMAYDRKQWSINNLCRVLTDHAEACGIIWGWGVDDGTAKYHHVLYVDLPTGQVSFHTDSRRQGPDYPRAWDGVRGKSSDRICRWAASLIEAKMEAAA